MSVEDKVQVLQTRMKEEYPTLDTSPGTVIYELLIKPAAVQFNDQDAVIQVVRDNLSMTEALTSDNRVDSVILQQLSNFNVVPRAGEAATGSLNIYTRSETNIHIPASTIFSCGSVSIRPTKSFVGVFGDIDAQDTGEIGYVPMVPLGGGAYVFPIQAITSVPLTEVLSPGMACTNTLGNPRITGVETGSTFVSRTPGETVDEAVTRAITAVNAQVVTGRDNIRSLLRQQQAVPLFDAAVFGMGDPLQTRDTQNNAGISTGGRVDIAVKTAPVPVRADVALSGTRSSGGIWTIEIPATTYAGALFVSSVTYGSGVGAQTQRSLTHVLGFDPPGAYPLISTMEQARFSRYQTLYIQFTMPGLEQASADFAVSLTYMPDIGTLQAYLDQPGRRSRCFDHLVKSAVPVFISADITLALRLGSTAPNLETIRQAIAQDINRTPIGMPAFYSSAIVAACSEVVPQAQVLTPVQMRAVLYNMQGTPVAGASTSHIQIGSGDPYIAAENVFFCCYPNDLNIAVRYV